MTETATKRSYDEIVELERNSPEMGKPGGGDPFNLFWKEIHAGSTPEELLANELVLSRSYTIFSVKPTKNYSEFAAVKWPWGDARGLLRAGGRTYFEARLRLRDKLVESARSVAVERSEMSA